MGKKIFAAMCLLTLITALVFALLQGALFKGRFSRELRSALESVRVSIIGTDGSILFDNYRSNLDNHSDRPEVIQALQTGTGSSDRYSQTFGKQAYYFAVNANGTIIRLSLSTDSMNAWIIAFLSITAVSFLFAAAFSLVLAKKLTRNLIEPINSLDLNNSTTLPYVELSPFMRKIAAQKREIRSQFAALQNRTDTINAITENMQEGLMLTDKNGLIVSANKSVGAIFGTDACAGKNILHASRNADFFIRAQGALGGKRGEMTFEHRRRIYNVHFSPAKLEEEVNGAIILFLDITDKSAAEKQRREFSANVSHELKTPLTAISALSEMIASGLAKPEDITDFAQKINTQAQRLLTLINDIIRLSEFDETSFERACEHCNLGELARAASESLDPIASERDITITIDESQNTPVILNADRRMIDELLYNLIDNAIKYNKNGGSITVRLSEEKTDSGKFALVSVSDTGIGVSAEHQKHIFERFYRVDKSRSKKTGGTGLGLSIVKHITEHHNGNVSIESEEGKGTTIICRFKK